MNALKRELEVERKIRRSREGHVTDAEIQLEIDQAYHRFKSMPDYAMEWLLRCEDYKSLANAQTSNLYTLKEKNLGMQRIEVEIGHLEWMAKDLWKDSWCGPNGPIWADDVGLFLVSSIAE